LTARCSARCQSIFSGNDLVRIAAARRYRKRRQIADPQRVDGFLAIYRVESPEYAFASLVKQFRTPCMQCAAWLYARCMRGTAANQLLFSDAAGL